MVVRGGGGSVMGVVTYFGEEGQRAAWWLCGGLFPTGAVGITYLLNNQIYLSPVGSAGWRVMILRPIVIRRSRVQLSL